MNKDRISWRIGDSVKVTATELKEIYMVGLAQCDIDMADIYKD